MNRETGHLRGIEACVFDAYGTIFDVNSAVRGAENVLGERSRQLAELWRTKQLQYAWLRGLAGHYADFRQVTGDALDFALSTMQIENSALRERLLNSYFALDAFPEVTEVLHRLKAGGMRLAILSNGTPTMLAKLAVTAGIDHLFEAVLSVEEVKVYKPHPAVYGLACDRLHLAPGQICFISSNGWDAYSAKAFGYSVVWCNRSGQAAERLPQTPDAQIATLAGLSEIVLG